MKYIFWGTPRFAEVILKKLIDADMPPIAVVCNPDKPYGRKKEITPPPVKKMLLNSPLSDKIELLQPTKLDDDFLDKLKQLEADFYIVAAYSKILKTELINIPPMGVLGVHPSLLPKYRGSTPIQSVILGKEDITGVSLFMIDERVDNGPVLVRGKLAINEADYLTLQDRLAELAGNMLITYLPRFYKGELAPEPQDHDSATFTHKFSTEDGFVEYENLEKAKSGEHVDIAKELVRKIRALNPEPGVYTFIDKKRVKLLRAKLVDDKLVLLEIQKEGKKPQIVSTL